jgi:hypothetical protein
MNITVTRILSAGICLAVGVGFAATSLANGGDPANYIGPKACGICHKKDETGNQLAKWQASPHAKAFETLGTDKAREVAKAKGIEDPQKSGVCLKCHSTAYHMTDSIKTEKIKVEEGVTCESCHGPGKKYMAKSTMESREKSIAAGMIYPATKTCTQCHNEENPTFKGFDEKTYAEKIAHPNPAAKK